MPLGKALVGKFSDGEVQVEIEENVRGQDVFVIQPTCAPTAENFMELLVLIDALKRASAAVVTAVVPYFGYARQDRRPRSARVPITAKVAAKMFVAVDADRVLTVDLHADQIQGFFDMPVDNVYASPLLLADIWRSQGTDNLIVVSPDVGGVVRARAIAKRLDDADLAIIDKRRPKAERGHGDEHHRRRRRQDLRAGRRHRRHRRHAVRGGGGAEGSTARRSVVAYCTHPVLSGAAIDNINGSQLDELVVTDTIPLSEAARACTPDPPAERGGAAGGDRSAASRSASRSARCTWIEARRTRPGDPASASPRSCRCPIPLPGTTRRLVAGCVKRAIRRITTEGNHNHGNPQHHGYQPQGRGQGCEPPPASQRPGPGHRLRRQGRRRKTSSSSTTRSGSPARTSGSTRRS